jgi:hypothetical protein
MRTEQTNNKDRASRQTHTQRKNKNNEGKQRKNTNGNTQSVTTSKKAGKKQRSRVFQAYDNKLSYTLEDGHVGRNM